MALKSSYVGKYLKYALMPCSDIPDLTSKMALPIKEANEEL